MDYYWLLKSRGVPVPVPESPAERKKWLLIRLLGGALGAVLAPVILFIVGTMVSESVVALVVAVVGAIPGAILGAIGGARVAGQLSAGDGTGMLKTLGAFILALVMIVLWIT